MVSVKESGEATTLAVVVGADANGLGVVRSLGKRGVPVVAVDDDPRRPGMHSRYARGFVVPGMSGLALIDGLLALRAQLNESPVLFLTTHDYCVHAVSEHRALLKTGFRVRLPEHRLICELLHKSSFQRMAERYGFPVPRAATVRSERDLAHLADIRFPAVIKPGSKELFFQNKAPRARRVVSREQAELECRDILPRAPDLIVQEWIDGAESDIYFCLQYRGENGVTVSSFVGRKLRCWPPQTGNTVSCVAAPEMAPVLEPLTRSFFDSVGFVGMCSMEFKLDRPSARFLMVEPTVGRTDWQEEVATLNGVNIPFAAYCHELGLPLPAAERARHPMIWRAPTCYWRSVVATRSVRNQGLVGAKVRRASWRFDDPVPLAFFCFEWLRKASSSARWRPRSPADDDRS